MFVYLIPEAELMLNPALMDMSTSTHSDNHMNIITTMPVTMTMENEEEERAAGSQWSLTV